MRTQAPPNTYSLHAAGITAQVIHGEIAENPLESLAAVSQDVFMPVLTAPANQQGWPDVVAKEVSENLHKFVSQGACPVMPALQHGASSHVPNGPNSAFCVCQVCLLSCIILHFLPSLATT